MNEVDNGLSVDGHNTAKGKGMPPPPPITGKGKGKNMPSSEQGWRLAKGSAPAKDQAGAADKGKGKPPSPPPVKGKGTQSERLCDPSKSEECSDDATTAILKASDPQSKQTGSGNECAARAEHKPVPKPEAATSLAVIGKLQLPNGSWTLDEDGCLASAVGITPSEFREILHELVLPTIPEMASWEVILGTSTARQAIERCASIVVAETDGSTGLDQKGQRRQALAIAEAQSQLGESMLSTAQLWLDESWRVAIDTGGAKLKLDQKRISLESRLGKMLDKQLPRPDWRKTLKSKKNIKVTCPQCGKEFSGAVGKCPSCKPPEAPTLQRPQSGDLLRRWRQFPSAPVRLGTLDWAAADGLLHLEGGSGGVTLLHVPQGVIGLKPLMMNGVAEFFAGSIAEFLSIPIAKSRVVSMANDEFMHIKQALRLAPAEIEEDRAVARRSHGRSEFIALLEFVPGLSLQGLEVHNILQRLQLEVLQDFWCQVGRLVAFDVLINNVDRAPLLWDNEGNTANLLLLLDAKDDRKVSVVGIDQAVTAIIEHGPGRPQYLERVRKLVHAAFSDSWLSDATSAAASRAWSISAGLARVQEAVRSSCAVEVNTKSLMEGLRGGFTQIAEQWEDGSLQEHFAAVWERATRAFASATTEVGVRQLSTMVDFLTAVAAVIAEGRDQVSSLE